MWVAVTVSLVVAVHGVAAYLPTCLDSILLGAPAEVEVIAVDDASPDACGEILDRYGALDPRVRPVRLRRNVGLGAARNAGLERAVGEYVWFVDGDDLVTPGAVAAVVDRLTEGAPDVLLLGHALLQSDGRMRRDVPSRVVGTLREHPGLLRTRQAAWNRVVRRSLLDRAGLRFPDGWYEDAGFSHLVLLAAKRIEVFDRVCYLYRQRPAAITSTASARHFEVFAQYERLFATLTRWRVSDRMRARVFACMIEHYLVIVGADDRLPAELRPEFFARIVAHYHRYLPNTGYPVPTGVNGVKHRFIRWDAYRAFSTLRNVYRSARRNQRRQAVRPALGSAQEPTLTQKMSFPATPE